MASSIALEVVIEYEPEERNKFVQILHLWHQVFPAVSFARCEGCTAAHLSLGE